MLLLPEVLTQGTASASLQVLSVALAREQSDVVVDASSLRQFDSAALAVLLDLRRQAQRLGKTFAVVRVPQHLNDLARLYGIAELLPAQSESHPLK